MKFLHFSSLASRRVLHSALRLVSALFATAFLSDSVAEEIGAHSGEVPDYVRYLEGEGESDLLQTAIVRFHRGESSVDLIAAIHLGDASYFAELNERLREYDGVLYELVGGKFENRGASATDPANGLEGLSGLQQMAKSLLGLEFQLEQIDYLAPNLIHGDIDWDDYTRLMDDRNQSFATLFSRAMALPESSGGFPGLPNNEAGMALMMSQLLAAVTNGNSNDLKRLLAPFLAESEELIHQLEGDDGTVLISERNEVVLVGLTELIAERGAGNYAIFYGGGHMPHLEKRLLESGYTRGEESWLDAWTIPHAVPFDPAAGPEKTETVSPATIMLRLLHENPEFQESIRHLGTLMEQLQAP